MKIHRTIRYRLHPRTQIKACKLFAQAGACRFVWNHFVDKLRGDYDAYGASCIKRPIWKDGKIVKMVRGAPYNPYFKSKSNDAGQAGTAKIFTTLRRSTPWMQEYSSAITRAPLMALETCYKQFYKGEGEGGLPKFHGKYTHTPSFPLPTGTFKLRGDWLHIAKIGEVKLIGNNPYSDSKAVSGTIKHEAGNWYAFMVYEVDQAEASLPQETRAVGIDRNCGQVATSEGEFYRTPVNEKLEARKRRYQRAMERKRRLGNGGSRKKKRPPSKRYMRVRELHQKTCRKIVQERTNWCHQLSRELAERFDVVYLEDLNIRGMTASAKGTLGKPGRNVKQKRGLNRSILSSCWGKLERCLSYKTSVVKVPAPYTSQRCSKCGHTEKDNRASQKVFGCLKCGHRDHADVNAARNILASGNGAAGRVGRETDRGIAALRRCGGGDVGRPVKRQTDRKARGVAPVDFPI